MNQLIVHHFYARSAFDLSDQRNHGDPIAVTPATGAEAPSFHFNQPESEVRVAPEGLQELWSIRAVVTFNLNARRVKNPRRYPFKLRRYNLMEGQLSFALFVEDGGALMGTIMDRNGTWKGARSAPNLIRPGQWHTAQLMHDGVSTAELYLDGMKVAEVHDALGPVRPVGPAGVAVGHWAEPSGTYTFAGFIREAQLYRYDPYRDLNGLLDRCCMDRQALDTAAQKLRERGATAQSVGEKAREILQFAIEVCGEVRGGDAATAATQRAASSSAFAAFLRGDQASYTKALAQLAALTQSRLDTDQLKEIDRRWKNLVETLPLPLEELQELLHQLCWDRVKLDPDAFVRAIERERQRSRAISADRGGE